MKVLMRIGTSVLIVLFLSVGLCHAQSIADQSFIKGVEYASQGKFEEAKEEFEKALKVETFYGRAKVALKVIEDVIDQKIKRQIAIYFFRGVAYGIKGQYSEAITDYKKAIEINPRYAETYINRGFAYAKGKGQYDQAISTSRD